MSRFVALGAVLGFAVAVLVLALIGKEPPRPAETPPQAPPAVLLTPTPLVRPVAVRRELPPNGPVRAILPPPARVLLAVDAGQ